MPNSPLFMRCRHDCGDTVNNPRKTIRLDFVIWVEIPGLSREQAYGDRGDGRKVRLGLWFRWFPVV